MESFEKWADDELLAAFVARQCEEAFVALVGRHVRLVYSAAFGRLKDAQLAEDVVQAVFVLLARKAGRLRPGTILSGWLYRSAQLIAGDVCKAEVRRRKREELAAAPAEPGAEGEDAPKLDELLMQLGERDRAAILLRFFEEKSFREVGAALGMGEEAARKRIDRAVEKLRRLAGEKNAKTDARALVLGWIETPPAGMALRASTAALARSTAMAGSLLESIRTAVETMLVMTARRILPAGAMAAGLCLLMMELGRQLAPPISARQVVERHLEAVHADLLRKAVPPDLAGTACMSCHDGSRREEPAMRAVLLAGDWQDAKRALAGSFEIHIAGPERVLEEIAIFGAGKETRGRNGNRAWSKSAEGVRTMSSTETDEFRRESGFLMWPELEIPNENATVETFDGRRCDVVADQTRRFFDRASGLLIGTAWPNGTNVLSEYREFEGLRAPTLLVRLRGGWEERFHVRQVKIADVPVGIFDPPRDKRRLERAVSPFGVVDASDDRFGPRSARPSDQ